MPNLPISQLPLASSGQPESWMAIVNYDPDPSGVTYKIHFSALTEQFSGATGSSGTSGSSGTDGSSGTSGTDGSSGSSGVSGTSGTSGTSGSSGIDGTSGSSGIDGTSGSSGIDGTSGTSGSSGIDGTSGSSGIDGTSGTSGISGTSGTSGLRGSQWFQGSAQPTGSLPGIQDGDFYLQTSNDDVWTYGAGTWYNIANIGGTSGSSGIDGTSGTSGSSGSSGTSGTDGTSGTSGSSGVSPSYSNPVVFGLFAQTGDSIVVSATTTESTLIGPGVGSLQIPANGFNVGDSFMGRIVGHISSKNNDTIRIRVKTGSVVLGDSGLITMPQTTNKHYTIDCNFTIRAIGIAGVASIVTGLVFTYSKDASNAFEGSDFSTINNTTFDTTVSNTLNITVQWGSTDAQNSIYTEYLVLNKVY